jgi:phage terminase large subunit-like protein
MATFDDFLLNSSSYTVQAAKVEELAKPRIRRELPFSINKLNHRIPSDTLRWVRNAADERAVIEHGCVFIEEIGQYVVNWIESNCVLYEGDLAGTPMFIDDWQYELIMQSFGWQWFDAEWEIRRAGAGWLRRFKVLSGWVPKKNAKSPTLASIGLYLFAGDGEQGQKCFSLATTRDQALISHTHALNFVRQSDSLSSRCKIDATSSTIYDSWTNSKYSILCGDKGGLTTSKEGINGSLVIDETHVVTQAIMHVVKRAGISRRQPLQVQLSTAGENTAGYGFEQAQYGRLNLKAASEGRQFDFRFLHQEYAIPQDTSIDALRDPTKIEDFIRLSNPTLGRIVRMTEAKEDWQKSCHSDTELIKFAMYRLNQWNTGGGAFIAGSDWSRCAKKFTLDEVKDYPCVVGVDMSSIRDMTALVIVWAIPKIIQIPRNPFDLKEGLVDVEINIPHVLPSFWVPQRSLKSYEDHLDIPDLARRKQLRISETATIKPEVIAEQIAWIDSKFIVRGVASDMAYSRALSARLAGVHGWDVTGEDSRFFLIPQTFQGIGPAVQQLAGCILEKELVHANNEVLNWQLGNIVMIEDTNGNSRFAKPTKNDYRKIDGWAALANAFYFMMNDPELYPGRSMSVSMGIPV